MSAAEKVDFKPGTKEFKARLLATSTGLPEVNWIREGAFGHCPACGDIGMEHAPTVDAETSLFDCSNEKCLTVYEGKGNHRGPFQEHTKWSEKKPDSLRESERKGVYWNEQHFSPEFMEEHELV